MDGEEGGGPRLSKRIADGEVDYKLKSGTAWSHSFLNQKPWHPLSYPNQRRKWIAEQSHAQHSRRNEEISREYAQEQEFFRQTALISKKEKEKVELMQAVSFMYVRPPGYNAESAKAAEIADEMKKEEQSTDLASSSVPSESAPGLDRLVEDKKKQRPKDVFGRPLPTEEEFEALKNAPRLDTGVQGRAKPFGIEIRNVRCVRCGNYGHQSGDRECPLKDTITPNEQSRIKRDDPLTAILAHTDPSEPLKWELKQKPGVSPARGGFKPDDPNQQIVAEDIYDEYGGFLSGGDIPELIANFTSSQKKKQHSKRRKQKRNSSPTGRDSKAYREANSDREDKTSKKEKKKKNKQKKEQPSSDSSASGDSDTRRHHRNSKHKHFSKLSEDSDSDTHCRNKKKRRKYWHSTACEDSDSSSSKDSYLNKRHRSRKSRRNYSSSSEDSGTPIYQKGRKTRHNHYYSSDDSESVRHNKRKKSRHKHYHSSEDSESYSHRRSGKVRHRH